MLEVMSNQIPIDLLAIVGLIFLGVDCMKYKYIGILEPKIADKLKIPEHKNKPILVYSDRIEHVIEHHLKDFGTKSKIISAYNNLRNIIKNPDYVFLNIKNNSIEYYKNINNGICVAVRISAGKVLKVRSWFPLNKSKISNRIKKEKEELDLM